MNRILKKLASGLSSRWQQELKHWYYLRQIRRGRFLTDEMEFQLLEQWVAEGDWVVDIGANVGHYTCKLSRLVGRTGRVIAMEPAPANFELLAANSTSFSCQNVTLVNAAASDSTEVLGLRVPKFDTGLDNYYMANLTEQDAEIQVLCLTVDSLAPPGPVKLVKIDVEGHELSALRGMRNLLMRDHPVLIVEDSSPAEVSSFLEPLGYSAERLSGSCNTIFERRTAAAIAG